MIGYFGYSMWLTYLSLISSVIGIFVCFSDNGHPYIGSMCLLLSGLCDAFDGKVARTDKNRTERQKRYGVQIDSLSDLVAFGVLPACIGAAVFRSTVGFGAPTPSVMSELPYEVYVAVFCVYVLAALVRLAWFNVSVEETPAGPGVRQSFTGLPVTSAALIFPTFLLLRWYLLPTDIGIGYFAIMLITAALFVGRFNVRKPGLKGVLIMVGIGLVEFILLLLIRLLRVKAA